MVKDLDFMKDITPLFEKQLVIWGIGQIGRIIIEDIKAAGGGKKGILLCDSDCGLWGEKISGSKILSPDELQKVMVAADLGKVAVLVTVHSISAQNEIIKSIEKVFGTTVDIYTEYAIQWGMYFNLRNPFIDERYREKKTAEHEIRRLTHEEHRPQRESALKYFTFLPLHNDEIILIYQPGKVASSSLYQTVRNYKRNVLHCHLLSDIGYGDDTLYNLLNLKSGKIISLVRDPVERRISELWQNIHMVNRYSAEVDFAEIEKWYFDGEFWKVEFEWFYQEMKAVFQIDVFEHTFDVDKGYTIIKQGNIELLLMKMEKLNGLEEVIGEFLGIDQFRLQSANVGKEKAYRFARQAYQESFTISKKNLEEIYRNYSCMKHFYSELERDELYRKWMKHAENI